ncbi:MAG TPA: hypothetical protein VGL71_04275, partial [Urbifossiella sp.]
MKTVNRIAIAVTMREPYLAWARAVAGDDTVVEAFTTVYLVDEPAVLEPDRLIQKHFAKIFEEQLNSWSRDESSWPVSRTVKLFREW